MVASALSNIASIIGIAAFFAALLAALLVQSRTKGVESSVTLLSTANSELREDNADMRRELAEQKVEFNIKLQAQDADCRAELAKMQGRLDALTGQLAKEIVAAVYVAIKERGI